MHPTYDDAFDRLYRQLHPPVTNIVGESLPVFRGSGRLGVDQCATLGGDLVITTPDGHAYRHDCTPPASDPIDLIVNVWDEILFTSHSPGGYEVTTGAIAPS